MNTKLLYEKWGSYTDTYKLVNCMTALLSDYEHNNTQLGICSLLNRYFKSKQKLIELFMKSENYAGDMRIILDIDMDRKIDENAVFELVRSFHSEINAQSVILKKTDEDGKTRDEYCKHNKNVISITDLLDNSVVNELELIRQANSKFTSDGYSLVSANQLYEFEDIVNEFSRIYDVVLPHKYSNDCYKKYHINKGQKTNRAFNKVCTYYGVDKLPQYNKLFAKYSDLMSTGTRKMKYIISLNPLDYLTMSFGNSWASCHTIDRRNKRGLSNSYEGKYCGGTLSYMLDSSSIVTYVLDEIPDDITEQGKIYRNMFHFENDVLIQGRVYPQSNDGATDLYQTFRNVMQGELSKLIGLEENLWVKSSVHGVESSGVHYKDYECYNSCSRSYPKERPEAKDNLIHIGSERVCIECGSVIDDASVRANQLSCYSCEDEDEDEDNDNDGDDFNGDEDEE